MNHQAYILISNLKKKTVICYINNFTSQQGKAKQVKTAHISIVHTKVNIDVNSYDTYIVFGLIFSWKCVIWSRESLKYSSSFFPWLLFDILGQVQMCLAYGSLRVATNKYGVGHYRILSWFPRNVGNVQSRQRFSQMSTLCWVFIINNNQQHAYIIPLLSTSTYSSRKERWIRKRFFFFKNVLKASIRHSLEKQLNSSASTWMLNLTSMEKGLCPNKNVWVKHQQSSP